MSEYGIVTGGSGFLGQMHCSVLSEIGLKVISIDLKNPDVLNPSYIYIEGDITDFQLMDKRLKNTITRKDHVRVILNNAARNDQFTNEKKYDSTESSYAQLISDFKIATVGPLNIINILKSDLTKHNLSSSIIFIGSDLSLIAPDQRVYINEAGDQTFTKDISYSITKHAVIGLMKYLAVELAPFNIRVNTISPGSIFKDQPNFLVKNLEFRIPFKRLATLEDLTGVVRFLSSDESRYITGQNIIVDGGRTIW